MKKVIFICLLALCFIPLTEVTASAATDLKQRLMGRIVLRVQSHGEAYYISPKDKQIYYVASAATAFSTLQSQGLGISEKDFAAFYATKAPKRLAGWILLRVQTTGEAYYVNPLNLKLYSLNNFALGNFGLGITNTDLITLLNQNTTVNGNTNYQDNVIGFQISVPASWKLPTNISLPEFFSTDTCAKQSSFTCPSFKVLSRDWQNGPDAEFNVLDINPVRLPSLIPGADVVLGNTPYIPQPNDDSTKWDKVYSIFFPATQQAFTIYAPDRSLEDSILPTFKLLDKSAPQQKGNITYLISNEDTTKYCNGGDSDNSNAYRKTITHEVTSNVSKAGLSQSDLVKKTIALATTGMCNTIMKQTRIIFDGQHVLIAPVEGFAGVSIAMCYCTPQVEVNLKRIPGITNIYWY